MIDAFSRALLGLYRGTRAEPVDAFQAWGLNQLRNTLPFDSAAWGTGVITGHDAVVHSIYLHNLPQSFMHTWERFKHQDHTVQKVALHPGQTINVVVRDEYAGTDILEHHCMPVGMEHILCTEVG